MTENILLTQTKEKFFKNRGNLISLVISVLINAATWAYILLKIKPQSDPIYLHYNIYFGIDLIGQWYRIFLLPATGLVIGIINFLIARVLYKKNVILAHVLIWLTIVLLILLLLATHLIIRQN